jgi:ribosomal protein S27AE
MLNPIFMQAHGFDSVSAICLQHLWHLPIFLSIVLVAAFFVLPMLLYGSLHLINAMNNSLSSNARREFGCPNCGESVKPEWDFCPKCGTEVYLPEYPVVASEEVIEYKPHKPELPMHIPNFLRLVARPKKTIVHSDKN